MKKEELEKIIQVVYLDGMMKGRELQKLHMEKAKEMEEIAELEAKEIEKEIEELVRHAMNKELKEEKDD